MKFYHGGVKNLKIGDLVLPYSVTGCRNVGRNVTPQQVFEGHSLYHKVYITTDLNAAKTYASVVPSGDVYVVEPIGSIGTDIDAPGISFICDKAKVISIVQRRVGFKTKRIARML